MPSKRLPIYQPRSKRQTKLLLVLKVLLHIALAECIRFVLYRLIKTFPQRYWLVLVLPLCAIISNEFLRVWFMKKTKQMRSSIGQGRGQITAPKFGQGGKWQHESEEKNKARLERMQKLIDEKNKKLGVNR